MGKVFNPFPTSSCRLEIRLLLADIVRDVGAPDGPPGQVPLCEELGFGEVDGLGNGAVGDDGDGGCAPLVTARAHSAGGTKVYIGFCLGGGGQGQGQGGDDDQGLVHGFSSGVSRFAMVYENRQNRILRFLRGTVSVSSMHSGVPRISQFEITAFFIFFVNTKKRNFGYGRVTYTFI